MGVKCTVVSVYSQAPARHYDALILGWFASFGYWRVVDWHLQNLLSWSWFVLVAMLIFRGANMIHLDFSREQSMLFLKVYSFWSFSKQS